MEVNESASTSSSKTPKPTLPSEIYVLKLIESHSLEINSLTAECKTKSPKLMSQRLPRFMRRRAASHNPKRVPKSVRQSFINQTESVPKSKNLKKNKKKYVNKEKSELSLKRRHQKSDRSVLHVWFAKRFQMKMYWNHLIPQKNSTKNERLLYHNSKNDVVFYYLSHYSCLEIDYSKSERQQLITFLSKFTDSEIGCTFGAKIFNSDDREGNTVLYDYNCYPLKPLVSLYFLWNQKSSKLWLWIHISVYEKVLQLFTENSQKDYSNKFEFNRRTKQLERFRLIGPKALQFLCKRLKFEDKQIDCNQVCDNSVHYLRFVDNHNTLIDSKESKLFTENLESVSSENAFDFILVLKNRIYKNRFTIDLIVSSNLAKTLWQKIVENRGHRTGGLHDLEMIAFNTSSLLFPTFGFIDIKENEIKIEKLKQLLEIETKEVYVIRNELILSKLSKNITSKSVSLLLNMIGSNIGLINVELVCVDRGVPQQFDYICVPTEEDIQRVVMKKDYQTIEEMETNENTIEIKRKIIGLIEFGKYSLETSRGKGLGVITVTSLKELIEINDKISFKNKEYKNDNKNKLFVAFKSFRSGLHRIASIKVIDSIVST